MELFQSFKAVEQGKKGRRKGGREEEGRKEERQGDKERREEGK